MISHNTMSDTDQALAGEESRFKECVSKTVHLHTPRPLLAASCIYGHILYGLVLLDCRRRAPGRESLRPYPCRGGPPATVGAASLPACAAPTAASKPAPDALNPSNSRPFGALRHMLERDTAGTREPWLQRALCVRAGDEVMNKAGQIGRKGQRITNS